MLAVVSVMMMMMVIDEGDEDDVGRNVEDDNGHVQINPKP